MIETDNISIDHFPDKKDINIIDNTKWNINNWVLDIIDEPQNITPKEKIKKLDRIERDILIEIRDSLKKDNNLIIYSMSKNDGNTFFIWLKKVLNLVSNNINNHISEYINDHCNLDLKESNKYISKIQTDIRKDLLSFSSKNSIINHLLLNIKEIYTWKDYILEDWKKIKKNKTQIAKENQIKENIRYLFSREWVDMSFENLWKIIYKYIK